MEKNDKNQNGEIKDNNIDESEKEIENEIIKLNKNIYDLSIKVLKKENKKSLEFLEKQNKENYKILLSYLRCTNLNFFYNSESEFSKDKAYFLDAKKYKTINTKDTGLNFWKKLIKFKLNK